MPADIVVHHPSVNGAGSYGDTPGTWTPAQWRDELARALDERQERIALYSRYYDGQHRLQFATSKFKEAFGELFEAFATNWMALICDSAVERLNIQGFRFGENDADDEAWAIWQANGLDAKSISGHTEAIKCGTAYLVVGPPTIPGGQPVITVEHPSQVIVAHDESDRRVRLAALKRYRDIQTGDHVAVVYLPDRIVEYRRPSHMATLEGMGLVIPVGVADYVESSTTPNPLGIVPIIPLENNPSLLTGGRSDIAAAIPLNDAANKFFSDMIHASEFTSFPQRVLTGVELPRDPITGEVADEAQIRAAVSRLWTFESTDAKVFDLQAGSLDNYVAGIRVAVQHMAAQTRTPPHYLLAEMVNISGDALVAAETGLVARCRRKHIDFSDSWEEAMRLAFRWRALARPGWVGSDQDMRRADLTSAETIWADPESRNPGQVGDALIKKKEVGVPDEILWEEAGYTPQQIKRMKVLRDAQLKREAEQAQMQMQAEGAGPGAGGEEPPAGRAILTEEGLRTTVTGLPGLELEEPEEA